MWFRNELSSLAEVSLYMKNLCVNLVYLQRLHYDTRSTKHKILPATSDCLPFCSHCCTQTSNREPLQGFLLNVNNREEGNCHLSSELNIHFDRKILTTSLSEDLTAFTQCENRWTVKIKENSVLFISVPRLPLRTPLRVKSISYGPDVTFTFPTLIPRDQDT